MSAISVLFVCHGNICRSTMAQQYLAQTVLKATATDSPLKRIKHIDSCGVGDDDLGSQPDPGTQTVLQNHGMPKLSHVARLFDTERDKNFNYILCMDTHVMMNVKRSLKGVKTSAVVQLLGDYDPQGKKEVFNPWMCPISMFEDVYQHISRSINKFLESL